MAVKSGFSATLRALNADSAYLPSRKNSTMTGSSGAKSDSCRSASQVTG
nr:hypothetical protein [Streptomyces kasugaensis]